MCAAKEVDMTEYLDIRITLLEERERVRGRDGWGFVGRKRNLRISLSNIMNKESVTPARKYGKSYSFRIDVYLGTSVEEEGGMETEITNRVWAGWINWKKCSGVLSISIWGRTMCANTRSGTKTTRVAQASKNDHERRLKWYSHVWWGETKNTYWGKCCLN